MTSQNQHVEIYQLDDQVHGDVRQDLETVAEVQSDLGQKSTHFKISENFSHSGFNRNLPVEIIYKIFIIIDQAANHHRFPDESAFSRPFPEDYFCASSIVSSVCRRWREIALTLPNLWANVYINLGRKPDNLTEDWHDRSRPLPLNLTLYESLYRRPYALDGPIFQLLRSHSARWGYLNLHHAPRDSLYKLFNNLKIFPKSSDSFYLQLPTLLYKRPVTLRAPLQPSRFYTKVEGFLDVIPFDWNNLTHLAISNRWNWIDSTLNFIRMMPQLQHCVLCNIESNGSTIGKPVVHRSLNYLELHFWEYDTRLITNITLPSLKHLKYHSCNSYSSRAGYNLQFRDLEHFIARSDLHPGTQTSLETFTLEYIDGGHLDYRHSSSMKLTAVTHLSFDLYSIIKTFRTLLHKLSNTDIFPHLEELHLKLPLYPCYLDSYGCSLLCDVVTVHNCGAKSDIDLQTGTSAESAGRKHPKRPLKLISIVMTEATSRIKIKKDVLLHLRDAQKAGLMKLKFIIAGSEVDVLDPKVATHKVDDDSKVTLALPPKKRVRMRLEDDERRNI